LSLSLIRGHCSKISCRPVTVPPQFASTEFKLCGRPKGAARASRGQAFSCNVRRPRWKAPSTTRPRCGHSGRCEARCKLRWHGDTVTRNLRESLRELDCHVGHMVDARVLSFAHLSRISASQNIRVTVSPCHRDLHLPCNQSGMDKVNTESRPRWLFLCTGGLEISVDILRNTTERCRCNRTQWATLLPWVPGQYLFWVENGRQATV